MWALVTSILLATLISAGLIVRPPRSSGGPAELSCEVCDLGTDDEELVLREPLHEL